MYSALVGTFFLLSIGILMAHAMEGLALRRGTSEDNLARMRRRADPVKRTRSGGWS